MTRISGNGTGVSQVPGCGQCTASITVTWQSVTQPSSAPSCGSGIPLLITWPATPETCSPGRISWLPPWESFHDLMTNASSSTWVST